MSQPRSAVVALSLLAAALSLAAWRYELHGAPRIIDATMYWRQARALADGSFTWPVVGSVTASVGRFTVLTDDGRVGGIFPSGWPLLLSLAMRVGAPWLAGCALAAALTALTASLAGCWCDARVRTRAVVLGAALSALHPTLRVHTAETLSHGAAALFVLLAVRALADRVDRHRALLCGLALGALVTVRPVSTLAVGALCAWRLARRDRALVGWMLLAASPGALAHLAMQRAVVGRWGVSTQALYYARSDGPAGCFVWGFGDAVGCRVEHGDFVARYLPHGHHLAEAFAVTARRFSAHLRDVAGSAWLAPAWVLAAWRGRSSLRTRAALALVALHAAAYAPFYFDGNVDGGGARMLVDVLPVEHALLAAALASLRVRVTAALVAALWIAGVLCDAQGHGALARRARDVAEPDGLPARGVLVVAHDAVANRLSTGVVDPRRGLVVFRARGDVTDGIAALRLGVNRMTRQRGDALVDEVCEGADGGLVRGASLWPARAQVRGWIAPRGDGSLRVVPDAAGRVEIRVAVPVPSRGRWCVDDGFSVRCDAVDEALVWTLRAAGTVRAVRLWRTSASASAR